MRSRFEVGVLFMLSPAIASAADCVATNYQQLNNCVANNTNIYVAADITLTSNQKISIVGKSNITIDGYYNNQIHALSEDSQRYGQNAGVYINVENSSGIKVKNIKFKSNAATLSDCIYQGAKHETASCDAPLRIYQSHTVLVENTESTAVKRFQLQIASSEDVWIKSNHFSHAATFGAHLFAAPGAAKNKNVNFYQNTFTQIGANAILLADIDGSWVGDNNFFDNHILTQYNGVGGGQVVIEQSNHDSSNISITGNLFKAATALNSTGFEFAAFDNGTSLSQVNMQWNRFEGNPNDAITVGNANAPAEMSSVVIKNNEFINNYRTYKSQLISKAAPGIAFSDNYVESAAAAGIAGFGDTATSCSIIPGTGHCNVDIKWDVSQYSGGNLIVTVRSAASSNVGKSQRYLFAGYINSDGMQSAPWVNSTGSIFELYYESDYAQQNGWESPVATILVKGI